MRLLSAFLLVIVLAAQVRIPGPGGLLASIPTPGLISAYSANSTGTNATGTTVNSCANNTYCMPLPATTVGGELIIATFVGSAALTSAADSIGNAMTCLTAVTQATDGVSMKICYIVGAASGVTGINGLYPAATTKAQGRVVMYYNGGVKDVNSSGNTGSGGSASNDVTAGSMTPTVNGDLIYMVACRTQTPAATSFTAGSAQNNTTWSLLSTDIHDGCVDQWGIQSTAGAINSQITTTGASRYMAQAIAFKAATAGTAPTGMYVRKIQNWSTPASTAGSINMQFPSSGNLLIAANSCGTLTPTGVNDNSTPGLSWTAGPANTNSPDISQVSYAANASADGTGSLTITTSGTGDCTIMLYDVVGAATSPFTGRQQIKNGQGGSFGPNGSSAMLQMLPGNTNGLTIFTGQQDLNTAVSFNNPSGAVFASTTYGGEGIDGPNPINQNGPVGHMLNTDNSSQIWYVNFAAGTTHIGNYAYEADSFMSAAGSAAQYFSIVQTNWASISATSTTLAVTMPATITAGNLLAVAIGDGNSRTVTKVCLDGGTCAAGKTFTQATSAASSNSTSRGDVWYLLSAPSGTSVITVTFSATATNREILAFEVARSSGSWAFDVGAHLNTQTGSGTANTGAAVTTSTPGFAITWQGVQNAVAVAPALANEFQAGWQIFALNSSGGGAGSSDGACVGIFGNTTSTTHTPIFTDTVSGDTFASSTAAFK